MLNYNNPPNNNNVNYSHNNNNLNDSPNNNNFNPNAPLLQNFNNDNDGSAPPSETPEQQFDRLVNGWKKNLGINPRNEKWYDAAKDNILGSDSWGSWITPDLKRHSNEKLSISLIPIAIATLGAAILLGAGFYLDASYESNDDETNGLKAVTFGLAALLAIGSFLWHKAKIYEYKQARTELTEVKDPLATRAGLVEIAGMISLATSCFLAGAITLGGLDSTALYVAAPAMALATTLFYVWSENLFEVHYRSSRELQEYRANALADGYGRTSDKILEGYKVQASHQAVNLALVAFAMGIVSYGIAGLMNENNSNGITGNMTVALGLLMILGSVAKAFRSYRIAKNESADRQALIAGNTNELITFTNGNQASSKVIPAFVINTESNATNAHIACGFVGLIGFGIVSLASFNSPALTAVFGAAFALLASVAFERAGATVKNEYDMKYRFLGAEKVDPTADQPEKRRIKYSA